jgi:hypothetical protein
MGTKIFDYLQSHLPAVTTGVFVEIGSDRYEGSTALLAAMAKNYGTTLISVDTSDDATNRLQQQFDNVEFVIETGSEWATKFSKSQSQIAVLYLDNFDYIYDISEISSNTRLNQQVNSYALQGIEMNNVNCQTEHMKQLLALLKLFHSDTVVIFDDTYQLNGCWVGKCGPCVTYLLCQGYSIIQWTTDCGMIMKKIA